jgi:hypothetical protein
MRLRWTRGRTDDPGDGASRLRAREWVGCDDAGETIARVVRVHGPLLTNWRLFHAVALDEEARVVELRPSVPGDRWLVVVKDRVVDRAPLAMAAVRRAEAALAAN